MQWDTLMKSKLYPHSWETIPSTLGNAELGGDMTNKICFPHIIEKQKPLIVVTFLLPTPHILCFLAEELNLYVSSQ